MPDEFQVGVLAFGPHPDDVEMCCGGALISMARRGHSVAVVDLTRGELASNGTVEGRREESQEAARIMGLSHRENLELPDGWLSPWAGEGLPSEHRSTHSQVSRVVEVLRRLRPELVLLPWSQARHPDHRAAHHLVSRALFFANVKNFESSSSSPRFKARQVLYYQMRNRFRPSFVLDISEVFETKIQAIHAYRSQFQRAQGSVDTLLNSPKALRHVTLRDQYYGAMLGVDYGEPYLAPNTLGINDPIAHFRANPSTDAEFFEDEV